MMTRDSEELRVTNRNKESKVSELEFFALNSLLLIVLTMIFNAAWENTDPANG